MISLSLLADRLWVHFSKGFPFLRGFSLPLPLRLTPETPSLLPEGREEDEARLPGALRQSTLVVETSAVCRDRLLPTRANRSGGGRFCILVENVDDWAVERPRDIFVAS